MILPIPGGVKSSVPVSVLALNADLSLVAAMAITSRFLLGLLWLFSRCGMLNSLLEMLCMFFFAAQTAGLEAPAVQEAKTKRVVQCLPKEQ